ncbi:MAG: choice-of-anchor S family protein [Candidatus Heimdallarchaeota archaeon]
MKRKYFILLILPLIVSLTIPHQYCQGLIEVGDVLQFKILHSKITATVGSNTVTEKGFQFFGATQYHQRTSVDVLVNWIGDGINVNYSIGDDDSHMWGYSENWYEYLIPNSVFYTCRKTNSLVKNWVFEDFSKGNYFFLPPYIYPSFDAWAFFSNYKTSLEAELANFEQLGYPLNYDVISQETDESIYFESWVGGENSHLFGKVFGASSDFNSMVDFGNQFQIQFSKTTGLVEGFRRRGWVSGTINDLSVIISLDYHYEAKGYSLPRFSVGRYIDFFPKTYLYALIPSVVVLIGVASFFIVKYRKKKNKDLELDS